MLKNIKRLLGALKSKDPAVKWGILIKVLSPVSQTLDKIMATIIIRKNIKKTIPTTIMVVGPPRCGSTVIYQMLIRVLPSVYISNLHLFFPNFASWYLKKNNLFGTQLNGFNSYYGYTVGINNVNEGNFFIDKIFEGNPSRELIRKRYLEFISKMQASEQQPLVFKNIRNYKNILKLNEAVPEIIFIRIKRNIEQVIQSVLKAYYELGYFHPISDTFKEKKIDNPIEFAVLNILQIEKELNSFQKRIDNSKWIEWEYETFCNEGLEMIERLVNDYLNIDCSILHRNKFKKELKVSKRKKVNIDDEEKIRKLLNKYKKL